MNDVLYPVAAAVAWSALAYRLARGLRRDPRDPALYAVCTAFALMGIVFTVSVPAVWQRVDAALGVPNFALLFTQSGVIAFSGTIQCLILFWTHSRAEGWRRARRRVFWVLCVLASMALLFSLAQRREERPRDAAATYAHDPVYAAYLGCYIAMVAVGVTDIIRLCVPYARDAGRTWLSRGLWTTAAGAVLGLVYCAVRAGTLIAAQAGADPHRFEFLVPVVSSAGALLIVVGLTLPSLGPRLSRAHGWLARQRSYRELHPLWEAAAVTTPEVVLDGPGRTARFAAAGLDRRLSRRVIEIGDAIRHVRGHVDPAVAAAAEAGALAAGLPAERARAVGYAAALRAAFVAYERDRRAGQPPGGDGGPAERQRRARFDAWHRRLPAPAAPPAGPAPPVEPSSTGSPVDAVSSARAEPAPAAGGRDFAAEVSWLVEVSRALRSARIAAAAADAVTPSREPV